MSNAKHIPGPWIAQHRMRQDGKGGTQRWHILAGSDRSIEICNLPGWDEDDEANAALIAAAPDLLAALRLAKDAFYTLADNAGDVPEWNECGECYIAAEAVKAAIAKAEGAE